MSKEAEPQMPWSDPIRHGIKSAIFGRCHSMDIAEVDKMRKALDILPEKDRITVEDKWHACLLISEKPEEVRHLLVVADFLYPYKYRVD